MSGGLASARQAYAILPTEHGGFSLAPPPRLGAGSGDVAIPARRHEAELRTRQVGRVARAAVAHELPACRAQGGLRLG